MALHDNLGSRAKENRPTRSRCFTFSRLCCVTDHIQPDFRASVDRCFQITQKAHAFVLRAARLLGRVRSIRRDIRAKILEILSATVTLARAAIENETVKGWRCHAHGESKRPSRVK
jgi:hypothetical protein